MLHAVPQATAQRVELPQDDALDLAVEDVVL
jgi:hypothetical protein